MFYPEKNSSQSLTNPARSSYQQLTTIFPLKTHPIHQNSINPTGFDSTDMCSDSMHTFAKVLLREMEKTLETERLKFCFILRITQSRSMRKNMRIQEFLRGSSLREKRLLTQMGMASSSLLRTSRLVNVSLSMDVSTLSIIVMNTQESSMRKSVNPRDLLCNIIMINGHLKSQLNGYHKRMLK